MVSVCGCCGGKDNKPPLTDVTSKMPRRLLFRDTETTTGLESEWSVRSSKKSSFYSSKKSTRSGASPRRPLYSHSRGWKPHSPYRRRSEKKMYPLVYWDKEHMQPGPYLVSRKKKCFYNVRFPSRPLRIQMASSDKGTDAYIIHVDKACGVPDAQEV